MTITIDDFQKVEIRVGRVVAVEEFSKARKPSYKFTIDFGALGIKRSSVGVAPWYKPDELVGRLVVAVTNFSPRNVAGFESEVLVLGAVQEDGRVVLLAPESEAAPGSRIA